MYYLRRRLAYCDARRLCVCVCVLRAATARRMSLGGESNALYPCSLVFTTHGIAIVSRPSDGRRDSVRLSVRPSVRDVELVRK